MRQKLNNRNIIFNSILLVVLSISVVLFAFGLFRSIPFLSASAGAVIIISLVVMSVDILIRKERLKFFDWVSVTIYYITALLFVCAYLASIEKESLREVLVAISSAFIGGLLTLMGVGITIKYSRIEKEEDEIKKCKPRVYPISSYTWTHIEKHLDKNVHTDRWCTNLKKAKPEDNGYSIQIIHLANADLSMCVYDGILVDKNEIWFDYGEVLQKNCNYSLFHSINFKYKTKPKEISLLLTDMLDNTYKAQMSFELEKMGNKNCIKITSIIKTEMYIKDNKIRNVACD